MVRSRHVRVCGKTQQRLAKHHENPKMAIEITLIKADAYDLLTSALSEVQIPAFTVQRGKLE